MTNSDGAGADQLHHPVLRRGCLLGLRRLVGRGDCAGVERQAGDDELVAARGVDAGGGRDQLLDRASACSSVTAASSTRTATFSFFTAPGALVDLLDDAVDRVGDLFESALA